jgi:hypothetical protein
VYVFACRIFLDAAVCKLSKQSVEAEDEKIIRDSVDSYGEPFSNIAMAPIKVSS